MDDVEFITVTEVLSFEEDLLKRSQVFNDEKLRSIFKELKGYDYKTQTSLSIRDHLEYIKYKSDLISTINKNTICPLELKTPLLNLLSLNVIKLYQNAIKLFPKQYRLYENLFLFCKRTKQTTEISPYLTKWCEEFKEQPDPWIQAIYWEYEIFNNIDRARHFASLGLLSIPSSIELYKATIRMELSEATKQVAALLSTGEYDNILLLSLAAKRAEDLYDHSKKNIFEINFLIELLELCESFPCSVNLQNKIIKDLMELFPGKSLTWHTLAQRELKGYLVSESIKPQQSNNEVSYKIASDMKSFIVKEENFNSTQINPNLQEYNIKNNSKKRIDRCAKIYYKGSITLKTVEMWSKFIEAMLDLNKDTSIHLNMKKKYLMAAYKGAYRFNCLTESQFLQFIDLLDKSPDPEESEELLVAVLRRATDTFPTSIELWKLYMKYYIKRNVEPRVRDIFLKAVKKIGKESLDIWLLYKQYLLCIYSPKERSNVQQFFWEAIRFHDEKISSIFKSLYLHWTNDIFGMEGMEETRYLFRELMELQPQSYDMYKTMIEINSRLLAPHRIKNSSNSGNVDVDFEETKKCYEIAIEKFGKCKPSLWVDYIKFIRDYDLPKNISIVYDKALNTLDPECLDSFRSHYNLVINIL